MLEYKKVVCERVGIPTLSSLCKGEKMNKVEQFIIEHFEPQLETMGYCFADVEYIKVKDQQFLRLFIDTLDNETRIDIEDCEKVSRYLDEKLDAEAPMLNKEYILEVSSPGIERPLKRPKDFMKFIGELAEVRLYQAEDGVKKFVGTIESADENAVTFKTEEGKVYDLEYSAIAKANLYFEF